MFKGERTEAGQIDEFAFLKSISSIDYGKSIHKEEYGKRLRQEADEMSSKKRMIILPYMKTAQQ